MKGPPYPVGCRFGCTVAGRLDLKIQKIDHKIQGTEYSSMYGCPQVTTLLRDLAIVVPIKKVTYSFEPNFL